MNKRHYEHTLPNIRGSLSNTYPIWKIGFTGISNASASKYPINSMPPRANIKEPEPDKAKRIVCNPSGEKEISVPLFTEDKETCRFYSGEETIKKSTSNDCSQKCTHASSALLPP